MQVASPAHVRARASHIVTRPQPIVRAWRCSRARAALLLMAAGGVAGASGYVATAAIVEEPLEVHAVALAIGGQVVSQDEPRQLMAAVRTSQLDANATHDGDRAERGTHEPTRTASSARRREPAATLAPGSHEAMRSLRSTRQAEGSPTLAQRSHAKAASMSRLGGAQHASDALKSQQEQSRAEGSTHLRADVGALGADPQPSQASRREQDGPEITKDEQASRVSGSAIVRQSESPPSAASERTAAATSMAMVATEHVARADGRDDSQLVSTPPSSASDASRDRVESIPRPKLPATPTNAANATDTQPPSAAGTQPRALQRLEPHVHNLIVRGSLPSASVRRALARLQPELGSCQNARTDGAVVIASSWHTRTAIDEAGRTRDLVVTGPDAARAVSACLAHATSKLVVAAPDTGRVNASWDLRFEPVQ